MKICFISTPRKLFEKHNMCVVGEKGSGKDLVFGNVIASRKLPYVANMSYGYEWNELKLSDIMCSDNTYKELLDKHVYKYVCPYPDKTDVYFSDIGVHLPSQYNNELDKKYQGISMYSALCRQLGDNRFHCNSQALGRIWLKLREQATRFILCRWTLYIKGLNICITKYTLYDKDSSCEARVSPCRVRVPLFNREAKINAQIYRDDFFNKHGLVEDYLVIYHNKSKHNSRYFKELFENGKKEKKSNNN